MNDLAKLSQATTALAEAKTLEDIRAIVDIAEAARAYAKAARLGLDAQNHAAELKLRAERKAGELLAQLERRPGERTDVQPHSSLERGSEYRTVLEETETAPTTAHRWQTIAAVPESVFERHIAEVKAEAAELTSASVLRVAKELDRAAMHLSKRTPAPLPVKRYRVIYADPPWAYGNSGVINESDSYGRAARHYPAMRIDELCALPVSTLAADDAVLFLWVTSPLLAECFPVIDAWGFEYKTSFVWDKVGHNFGHYNSVRHELLLVCTRGSCLPDSKTLYDSVISVEKSRTHSEKPEQFRRMIDDLYTWGGRIELFARQQADGWDAWGNEPC